MLIIYHPHKMSLLDIPFDCLLPHLSDIQIRRLWSTCHQLKTDIEALGCFCRNYHCRKFLPKGTDVDRRCDRDNDIFRSRKFYSGHEDVLCIKNNQETKQQYLQRLEKYLPLYYSIELETKVSQVMKLLINGEKYEVSPGIFLKLCSCKLFIHDMSTGKSKLVNRIFIDDGLDRQYLFICDRYMDIPCEYNSQLVMAIMVGFDRRLVRLHNNVNGIII